MYVCLLMQLNIIISLKSVANSCIDCYQSVGNSDITALSWLKKDLIYSSMRSYVFIYSFIQLLIYSLFVYSFIYSFIHLFIYSFIHLFIYSFIHLFIYSLFIYLFIRLFVHSFIE